MSRISSESGIRVRNMDRCDVVDVMAIDAASFDHPWSKGEFVRVINSRLINAHVAEVGRRVVGFVVFRHVGGDGALHVTRFAVAPDWRGHGIGRDMAWRITNIVDRRVAGRATLHVRERNLAGINFWRSCGFRATGLLRDHYREPIEDAYVFEYRHDDAECAGR